MSRGLSEAFKDAISGSVVYPSLFVEFQFEDSTTRFWSGETDISWGGETWTGGGLLGGMKTSGEGSEITSRNITFTLNGVDQSYYSLALTAEYRNRPVKLWFNILNSTATTVLYSYLLEEARMNTLVINETDESITLSLSCESKLVDMFVPRRVFLNDDTNRKVYPSDYFYRWTPILNSIDLPWGLKEANNWSGGPPTPPNQLYPN